MAPSTSSAQGSGRGGAAWVLLHRATHVSDLDPAETGEEADVVLQLAAPPGVSTALLDRGLLDDAARPRILGADASGRLLFSAAPPRAPADSHLLVCRPVPDTSGETAKGKAVSIPAFPEYLGYALSEAAPTAILFDPEAKTGDGYFVAQLKSTPLSASAPATVAAALLFSSDANGWSVAEVPVPERWNGFCASSVVSHDRDVRGDSTGFVFVDLRRLGLLVLHPRRLTAARFIPLPVPQGGGEAIDPCQATVGSSEGRLIFVVFEEVDEGMLVRFWSLSEDELRWRPYSRLSTDRVFGRDARVWPLRGAPMLGPIDPNMSNRVVFGDRDATVSFFLEVTPDQMGLLRVSPWTLDSLVSRLASAAKATWTEAFNSAVEEGKHAGIILFRAVQKGRTYADSLPGAIELVGTTLSLPHTAVALTAARAIRTVNNYLTLSEYVSTWLWEHRPGQRHGVLNKVVGSREEADEALQEWIALGRPRNVMVDPAPGLSQSDWDLICDFLKHEGAESLIQHYDWDMVERPVSSSS